jgi:polyribonucleotide nucleotidyltransferase
VCHVSALAALAAGHPAAAAAAAAAAHGRAQSSHQQTHEMTVPNELIGCIIGKGGSKIAEIR